MRSELTGRLRNTHLPANQGLIPVYEAVVNSIEAIEEKNLDFDRPHAIESFPCVVIAVA